VIRCRELAIAAASAMVVTIASPAGADDGGARDGEVAEGHAVGDDYLARLGEHYYSRGMFYRAIGAFEELGLFTTDPATRRYAHLRVAMAYQHGGQLEDAVAEYDRLLLDRDLVDPDAGWIRVQRSLARGAHALADPLAEPPDVIAAELTPLSNRDAPYAELAGYHVARIRLLAGDARGARAARDALARRCVTRPVDDCAVLARLDDGLAVAPPPRRSPVLALGLSAVVPGLGSIYAGHVVDGLYYAALTTLFGLGAWDVHDPDRASSDQKVSFYVLGVAAVVTHVAGLAQAYFGARRFNLVHDLRWRERVVRRTELPLPFDVRPIPGARR
jgi:hypothetical protein